MFYSSAKKGHHPWMAQFMIKEMYVFSQDMNKVIVYYISVILTMGEANEMTCLTLPLRCNCCFQTRDISWPYLGTKNFVMYRGVWSRQPSFPDCKTWLFHTLRTLRPIKQSSNFKLTASMTFVLTPEPVLNYSEQRKISTSSCIAQQLVVQHHKQHPNAAAGKHRGRCCIGEKTLTECMLNNVSDTYQIM